MNSHNFHPLKERWPQLYEHAAFAEQYAHTDPHTVAVKLRCFAEVLVGFLYRELRLPSEPLDNLLTKLKAPHFQEAVGETVLQKLHALRMLGNKAAHGGSMDTSTSLPLIEEAYLLGQWLCKTYSDGTPEPYPTYEPPTKPTERLSDAAVTAAELANQLAAAKEELSRLEAAEKAAQAEIAGLNKTLDEARLLDFKSASAKASGTIDFKPENTCRLINIHDAFAGYDLTEGQSELVNCLERFLNGRTESVFLLKGYAGTGKTFITKGLTEYFRAIGRNYVLAAPTGKASKVIAVKTQSPAYTIHKSIYSFDELVEYRDEDIEGTETYKFYANLAVNSLSADTVYIVDEASMIPDIYQEAEFFRFGTGFLLSDFLKFVNLDHNDHSKKVIFIGDDAQLPPVGMNFSPALNADYLYRKFSTRSIGFELSEVVRQKSESGVIANAIPLRKALQDNVFNKLKMDFGHPDVDKVEHGELMERYLESCGGKINGESIVIAFSNADVADYNHRIREHFFPGSSKVVRGDKVMAIANSIAGGIFISNGDFGQIREVISGPEKRPVTLRRKNPDSNEIEEIPISLEFKDVVVGFRDINGAAHYFEAKIIEDLLYTREPGLSSDQNKALYLDFCIRNPRLKRNSPEFKHALKSDPYFNALRLKFGYAITCHKAQGSEWNNVFVKCSINQNQMTAGYFRWLYTAITRTAKNLYLLDPPNHTPPPPPEEIFHILFTEVCRRIDGTGINVDNVEHNQWQESYYFSRGEESARINIYYTSKIKISNITPQGPGALASELVALLFPLNGGPPFVDGDDTPVPPLPQFLQDFHEKLGRLCSASGITIQNVAHLQWALRYTFSKDSAIAVYNVYYNSKDKISKCQPVAPACSPGPLTSEVGQLLTNGMRG